MKTSTKVILSVVQIILMFVIGGSLTYNPLDIETGVLITSVLSALINMIIAMVKIGVDISEPKEASA